MTGRTYRVSTWIGPNGDRIIEEEGLPPSWHLRAIVPLPTGGSPEHRQRERDFFAAKIVKALNYRERQQNKAAFRKRKIASAAVNMAGLLLFCGLLAGCAGRDPVPIAAVQSTDQAATCQSITNEIAANNAKMQELVVEENNSMKQNIAAGITGAVIPVLYLWIDVKNAAYKEEAALQTRQQYLSMLAADRCKVTSPKR